MLCLKRVTSLLCTGMLLVSVAVGDRVPHFSESNHFASRRHNNAFSMQAGQSCPRAGACEVCQSVQIGQRDLHVCPDDGDVCDPELCFYSLACRCSPVMLQSPLLECNKTTNVFVEGKSVTVTYYTYVTPGLNVPDQSCFTTLPVIDSCSENCNETCISGAPPCVNNTKTGDFASCDADGCECIDERWLQPDCCDCDYRNYYGPDCDKTCTENCGQPRPFEGGCLTCSREGYEPPSCCNCTEDRIKFGEICKCKNGTNTVDGTCKEGFAPEDCCKCLPDYTANENEECKNTVCQPNCADYNSQTGVCNACSGGFLLPTCCNCPSDKQDVNGVCKCKNGTNTVDGTCKEGFAPEDCCKCLPDYTANENEECKKEQECSLEQNIYFLMDGSHGNSDFDSLLLTVQMLVAAFNPVSNQPGTKVSVVLFGDNEEYPPSFVSNITDDCEAIKPKLIRLQKEFSICRKSNSPADFRKYPNVRYKSLCAGGSRAAPGLNEIRDKIKQSSSVDSALVIMTDGLLHELHANDRTDAINALKKEELNLKTMIAAGIDSDKVGNELEENLKGYIRTPEFQADRVVVGERAIDVGRLIVQEMKATGIICEEYAKEIDDALKEVQATSDLEKDYYRCLRSSTNPIKGCGNPKCGGPVTIKPFEPLVKESLSLEDEILTAVEEVLERFEE